MWVTPSGGRGHVQRLLTTLSQTIARPESNTGLDTSLHSTVNSMQRVYLRKLDTVLRRSLEGVLWRSLPAREVSRRTKTGTFPRVPRKLTIPSPPRRHFHVAWKKKIYWPIPKGEYGWVDRLSTGDWSMKLEILFSQSVMLSFHLYHRPPVVARNFYDVYRAMESAQCCG